MYPKNGSRLFAAGRRPGRAPSPFKYLRIVLRSRPVWRAIADTDPAAARPASDSGSA